MTAMTGILLAAGASRRFGANKLLQTLADGEPLAVHACRHLLAVTDNVLAVVRPASEVLAEHLRTEGADVRICVDAEQGMGTSLAFGVASALDAESWLIALADMPFIKRSTIDAVAEAMRCGALIAAPCWQGQRGHPVGFSQVLRAQLLDLDGDVGAKSVIQSYRDHLQLIEVDDPGILRDIDHPGDIIQFNRSCL